MVSQFLEQPQTSKQTIEAVSPALSAVCCCMQGWRVAMEDAHILNLTLEEDAQLLAVFDGHGGKDISVFLGRHFAGELLNSAKYQNGDYEGALKDTYLLMDQLLLSDTGVKERYSIFKGQREVYANDLPLARRELPTSGSTAVVALLKRRHLWVANAGDSRCVLISGGRALELTHDHKPSVPTELFRIREAGGSVTENRVNGVLNLTRSIGDFEYKGNSRLPIERQLIIAQPEVTNKRLDREDEYLVLGCDGVWDMWNTQDLAGFVAEQTAQGVGLRTVAEEVCNRCLAADPVLSEGCGGDNVTLILVRLAASNP